MSCLPKMEKQKLPISPNSATGCPRPFESFEQQLDRMVESDIEWSKEQQSGTDEDEDDDD